MKRLVVLVSGNGSNLQAILDASRQGALNAQVCAVISNKQDAYGLTRAMNAGVPAVVKQKDPARDRREYDAELAECVAAYRPSWVVLAGWMRILSSAFLDRFLPDAGDSERLFELGISPPYTRVLNLHPALPGTFLGTHAIERAYEAYRRGELAQTGVMVHLVPDEKVDAGQVLAQEVIPFQPGDTLQALEQRVHRVEHRLLVESLRELCKETS